MGRAWAKFSLLFWKNVLLQRRHRLQTVIEIVVPVLFCALLVVIRSLVTADEIKKNTIFEPIDPFHMPEINTNVPPPLISDDVDLGHVEELICNFLFSNATSRRKKANLNKHDSLKSMLDSRLDALERMLERADSDSISDRASILNKMFPELIYNFEFK